MFQEICLVINWDIASRPLRTVCVFNNNDCIKTSGRDGHCWQRRNFSLSISVGLNEAVLPSWSCSISRRQHWPQTSQHSDISTGSPDAHTHVLPPSERCTTSDVTAVRWGVGGAPHLWNSKDPGQETEWMETGSISCLQTPDQNLPQTSAGRGGGVKGHQPGGVSGWPDKDQGHSIPTAEWRPRDASESSESCF